MIKRSSGVPERLARLADAVLLPCFDGTAAPDWVRRRVGESLGGVCLFARNVRDAEQVADMTKALAAERASVVIAIDEEAGDVTRLDARTGSRFPGAAALGRADDTAATSQIAREVGELLAGAGISLNLAPCADIALDTASPVIGSRSFGPEADLVARHTAAWVAGQQSAGVAACAKHFPGHGGTDADTHLALAVLDGDLAALRRDALPPFIAAIAAGTAAIMPGHLLIPAVDSEPATTSRRWLAEILRGDMGFDGVIVTDALEMAAMAQRYGIAGGAIRALAAGADLLCIGGETRPAEEIDAIRDAIAGAVIAGDLTEDRLADAAAHGASVGASAMRAARGGTPAGATGSTGATGPAGPTGATRASQMSVDIARRAVEIARPLPPLTAPVLVLRCDDTPNIAVGVVPWGPAALLDPAPAEIVLHRGDPLPADIVRAAGSVLVVTRDRHRHPWMFDVLAGVRAVRPDTVLVEMGITGVAPSDAPALASFGATRANARAVVDLLTGTAVTA